MEFWLVVKEYVLHLDANLAGALQAWGAWAYGLFFITVFSETGLVVAPFLPGDSLLFAAGAMASKGMLPVHGLFALFYAAAVGGDSLNYWAGAYFGPKIFRGESSLLDRRRLLEAHALYQRYGSKIVLLSRFIPVMRTVGPFTAGIGTMPYRDFLKFNLVGCGCWAALFVYGGYFFGNVPMIQNHFWMVIAGVACVSVAPALVVWLIHCCRRRRRPVS